MIEALFYRELAFRISRSGGPGGQHVNKVSSAVEALWHPASSVAISEEELLLIQTKLAHKLTQDGYISVRCTDGRSQHDNKRKAADRLLHTVKKVLVKPRARLATKASAASKQKRLETKKRNAEVKKNRQRFDFD